MITTHIKESSPKIDNKHPEGTDPDWKTAWDKGQEVIKKGRLKFKDKGDEEHYWKMVKSNPQNVPGLPAVYPPLPNPKLSLSDVDMSSIRFEDVQPLPCGHHWNRLRYTADGKIFSCKHGHEYDEHDNLLNI